MILSAFVPSSQANNKVGKLWPLTEPLCSSTFAANKLEQVIDQHVFLIYQLHKVTPTHATTPACPRSPCSAYMM